MKGESMVSATIDEDDLYNPVPRLASGLVRPGVKEIEKVSHG
jgi:hypothetical protein